MKRRAELFQASRAKPVYFSARDENISFVLIFFRTAAAGRGISSLAVVCGVFFTPQMSAVPHRPQTVRTSLKTLVRVRGVVKSLLKRGRKLQFRCNYFDVFEYLYILHKNLMQFSVSKNQDGKIYAEDRPCHSRLLLGFSSPNVGIPFPLCITIQLHFQTLEFL